MFYTRENFKEDKELRIEKIKKVITALSIFTMACAPSFAIGDKTVVVPKNVPAKYTQEYVQQIMPVYKKVSKEPVICIALDMLQDTTGEFSRSAILGSNLSQRPVKIEFKDLGLINEEYKNFDALGWKKGKELYIFINPRHQDAPAGAIAALLSHEALHQDEFNSIAEETYAWTMEAAVWTEILKLYPVSDVKTHPLVVRENTLGKLFEKGNYSNKYIKKTVMSNKGYKNLPMKSPGFDDL